MRLLLREIHICVLCGQQNLYQTLQGRYWSRKKRHKENSVRHQKRERHRRLPSYQHQSPTRWMNPNPPVQKVQDIINQVELTPKETTRHILELAMKILWRNHNTPEFEYNFHCHGAILWINFLKKSTRPNFAYTTPH